MNDGKELSEERWHAAWNALRLAPRPRWREGLLARYEEPQQHYHTAQHLRECLREFSDAASLANNESLVELAIWFHDAVYNPRAHDNEERSAELARQCFRSAGAEAKMCSAIADLVLATKHHVASTADQALLIDIDLAILGQSGERYAQYEKQIWQEYNWVPAEVFAEKRCGILQRFLARPRIYTTDLFFARYEAGARENLRRSIKDLQGT